jgi:hypothetical protein
MDHWLIRRMGIEKEVRQRCRQIWIILAFASPRRAADKPRPVLYELNGPRSMKQVAQPLSLDSNVDGNNPGRPSSTASGIEQAFPRAPVRLVPRRQ